MFKQGLATPGIEWVFRHDNRSDRLVDRLGFYKAEHMRTRAHKQRMNIGSGIFAKGRDAIKRPRMRARAEERAMKERQREEVDAAYWKSWRCPYFLWE